MKIQLSNSALFPVGVKDVFLTDKLFLPAYLISGVLQGELWVLDVPLLLGNHQKIAL